MNNSVFITGRLTHDPEITYYDSGKTKTTFTIAYDTYTLGNKTASFVRCEIWDKQANALISQVKKGDLICVQGVLDSYEYNGDTFYILKCNRYSYNGSHMVIKGKITDINDNYINISTTNGVIKVEYNSKYTKIEENSEIFAVNLIILDKKPVYKLIKVIY